MHGPNSSGEEDIEITIIGWKFRSTITGMHGRSACMGRVRSGYNFQKSGTIPRDL